MKHRINNKSDAGYQHDFDWDNIEILHKESNYFKRIIAEMFFMKKKGKNSINVVSHHDARASRSIFCIHFTNFLINYMIKIIYFLPNF